MNEFLQNLDGRIQRQLEAGPLTNRQLRESLGFEPSVYNQEMDRVLQRLRHEGKIAYVNRAWQLSDLVPCPLCNTQGRCTRKQAEQFQARKR